jgi:hypothetical protein
MHGTESGLKRSHECSKNQKDDTTIFSPTPTGDSLIAPSQSYTQKKREKKTIPLTYKSIKKSNAGSSFSKIPYHRRPTFGTAKDEQTSSKDGEFNGASGLQWIEEFSVSFYRTEPNRIQRNKLERVLLLYTPMNFERIFDILLQNETGSFKSNSTKLAHCQALDILNWLIAELTSLLSTSNSQKFK